MKLSDINKFIESSLSEYGIPVPPKENEQESPLERTQNLFTAIVNAGENTQDPRVLGKLYQLLETTGQQSVETDVRLCSVFSDTMSRLQQTLRNSSLNHESIARSPQTETSDTEDLPREISPITDNLPGASEPAPSGAHLLSRRAGESPIRQTDQFNLLNLTNLSLSSNQLTQIDPFNFSPNRLPQIDLSQLPIMQGTGEILPDTSFRALQSKLRQDSPLRNLSLENIKNTSPALYSEIITFLNKMVQSKNFNNDNPKEVEQFAEEVLICIQITDTNSNIEFRTTFELVLKEANKSCSDRVAFYQNMLQTARLTYTIPTLPHKEALLLIKQLYIIDILNRYASEYAQSKRNPCSISRAFNGDIVEWRDGVPYVEGVDVVEVFLDLQVRFREKYSLPLSAKHKNYDSALTEEDKKKAEKKIIEEMSEEKFIMYCLNIPLWTKRIETEKNGELARVSESFGEEMEALMVSKEFSKLSESERTEKTSSLQRRYEGTRSEILRQATLGLIRENKIFMQQEKR